MLRRSVILSMTPIF